MWHLILSLGLIGLQLTTTAIVVGFASRRSLLRATTLAPMVISAYYQFSGLERIQNAVARAFLGAASVFLVILYLDAALLSCWTFDAQGPTSSLGRLSPATPQGNTSTRGSSFLDRLRFGFGISLQSRSPSTHWAVKNLPPFSRSDPAHVPSRPTFLLRNTLKCLLYIFILRASSGLGNPDDNRVLFSSDRIPLLTRLGDVTASELGTRFFGVLGYWTVQYMVVDVLYSVLAITAVALRITNVDVWPPVFGWVSDAWSIRQFWGCFYHQLIRQGCSSIAHCVTYSFLRLRKGGLRTRYVFITLVFTVSGIFHTLCDVSQGISVYESGAMRFFCIQAMGIMFEDALQAVSKEVLRGKKDENLWIIKRGVGYLWLVAWLAWTSPVWIYIAMQRDTGAPIVPF